MFGAVNGPTSAVDPRIPAPMTLAWQPGQVHLCRNTTRYAYRYQPRIGDVSTDQLFERPMNQAIETKVGRIAFAVVLHIKSFGSHHLACALKSQGYGAIISKKHFLKRALAGRRCHGLPLKQFFVAAVFQSWPSTRAGFPGSYVRRHRNVQIHSRHSPLRHSRGLLR